VIVTYAVIALATLQAYVTARRGAPLTRARTLFVVGVNVTIVALMSRIFGPYVMVPALAAGILGAMASFPPVVGAFPAVYAAFAAAIVVPVVLEHVGVWGRTTAFDGGVMTVVSPIVDISWRAEVMMLTGIVVLLYVSGRFAHALAAGNRLAQRQLQLHAWHLRQLVPKDAAPAPPPSTDAPAPACVI
jgi:hypothetical protein